MTTAVGWLADHGDDLVASTLELVGIDSQNPPGETGAAVDWVESFVGDLGIETERVVADPDRPNLLFELPGRSATSLLYLGHVDTVPYDPGAWSHDPLGERADGRVYGRGATDMKGPLVGMLYALRAYVETGTRPPVDLQFAVVSDEETAGAAGVSALLDRGRLDADACVVGETTAEAGRCSVAVADRGSIWLTLDATGVAAHGSRPPLGENAIDRLTDAIADVRAWLDTVEFDIDDDLAPLVEESVAFYAPRMGETTAWELFAGPTVNLGTIEGGTAVNRVPERARARLDVRLTAGIDTPSVLAGIEAVVAEHPDVTVADVSWSVGTAEALDSPLVAATSEAAAAVSGDRVYRRSATGGGDIKDLRNAGLSAVEFAFGTETAHAPDEYITVEALERNAATFARLPAELAARADGDP